MKCSTCGVDVLIKPLYRNNPKGEKAVWRCEEHLDSTAPKIDAITRDIVTLIQGHNDDSS